MSTEAHGASAPAEIEGSLGASLAITLRGAQAGLARHLDLCIGQEPPLTASRYLVLLQIEARPGMSQSELARAAAVDRSSVVAMLDDLQKHKLVVRAPDLDDRRRHSLCLTERGRAMLMSKRGCGRNHDSAIAEALAPTELRTLFHLLDRLRQGLAGSVNETGESRPDAGETSPWLHVKAKGRGGKVSRSA